MDPTNLTMLEQRKLDEKATPEIEDTPYIILTRKVVPIMQELGAIPSPPLIIEDVTMAGKKHDVVRAANFIFCFPNEYTIINAFWVCPPDEYGRCIDSYILPIIMGGRQSQDNTDRSKILDSFQTQEGMVKINEALIATRSRMTKLMSMTCSEFYYEKHQEGDNLQGKIQEALVRQIKNGENPITGKDTEQVKAELDSDKMIAAQKEAMRREDEHEATVKRFRETINPGSTEENEK